MKKNISSRIESENATNNKDAYDSASYKVILLDDPVMIRVDKNPIAIIANTGSWVGNNGERERIETIEMSDGE